jgi:hypothetical protein
VNKQFYIRENRESGVSGLTYFPNSLSIAGGRRDEAGIWIDIDDDFHFSDVSFIDGNAVNEAAIFEREGRLVIGRVKEIENDIVNSEYYITFAIEKTGDCSVESTGYIFGSLAAKLRKIIQDPQKKKKVLEALVKKIVPRINTKTNEFLGLDTYSRPVEHRFSGRILNYARNEKDSLTFNPFFQELNIDPLIGRADREYDYVLNSPRFERYTATFVMPEGYAVTDIPERCVLTSQYGLFISDFRLDGNRLDMAVSFTVPSMRIPPPSYSKFTAFLKEIKTHLEKKITIKPYNSTQKPEKVEAFLPIKK